jgi:diguanylate cyclase (GGDEF)-like protein/PAS domain S-box-containing protein
MGVLRLTSTLALAVLVGETAAIAALYAVPAASPVLQFAVHTVTLVAVTWLVSYRLMVRPMLTKIDLLAAANDGLMETQEVLRQRIEERDDEVATTEHRLQDTIAQLDVALNNTRQGLCMYDADTRLVLCNDLYRRMYGLSAQTVHPGTTYREILQEQIDAGNFHQDPDRYIADIRAAIAKGEPMERFANLKNQIVRVVVHPLRGGGWVATHEDVTVQRRAETELANTRHFLETVIEHVPATILVKDAKNFRYVLLNQAGVEFFGLPREQIMGKTAHDFFPKDVADTVQLRDEELLASGTQNFYGDHAIHSSGQGTRRVTTKRLVIRGTDGTPKYLLGVIEDITERKKAEEQIVHLAHHDSLTGLPNRAAFNKKLAEVLDEASALNHSAAVMCIDLDRFKEVNDVYGHAAGDALLKEVTARLQQCADGAFIARLGGDEFIILVTEGAQPATAQAIAERLQESVKHDLDIDGHALRIGLSVGVALFPGDAKDATGLLNNADAALYRAKAEGRGTVRFFEQEMDTQLRERRAMQQELRSAIFGGQLALHYQPVSATGGEIVGFEALARWNHPIRGNIPPNVFIPLAEESSLIITIGEWILWEACREAASWPRPLTIAVNLSPVQFRHGDLAQVVHTILLETGLAPHRLELEITESVLIGDFSRAASMLRRLKTLGVRIAMDDFGTGYSSLSYLQSFPFDKIKIDRAFISNVERNVQSASIVRAVIGLGKGLKVPVVAEGVETREQLDFLTQEHCNEVQGFLLGRPLPIADYAEVLGFPAERKAKISNS